jgi:hypothetical protein
VQGLTPEQLYDSFAVVVRLESEGPTGPLIQNPGSPRRAFLETFALSERKTENPTTIIQALTLMNGGLVGEATTIESSKTLTSILELPGLTQNERIEAIYLTVLSRFPKPEEFQKVSNYIESGGSGQSKKRYADVVWALLNGLEFRTNH